MHFSGALMNRLEFLLDVHKDVVGFGIAVKLD